MGILELRCPRCHAKLIHNKKENIIKCEYCGTILNLEDENKSKIEKVVEKVSSELERKRDYHSSYDYKKKLDIERENIEEKNKNIIKQMIRILIVYFIFQIAILIIVKLC